MEQAVRLLPPIAEPRVRLSVASYGFRSGRNGVWQRDRKPQAFRRKRLHLMVQNPNILDDNARIHTAPAVTDLLR